MATAHSATTTKQSANHACQLKLSGQVSISHRTLGLLPATLSLTQMGCETDMGPMKIC